MRMKWEDTIVIDPEIRSGKPIIKGTRITAFDVLGWLASGMTYEDVLEDFPELTKEQLLACLGYAADREAITKIVLVREPSV